jgi:dGTPase
VPFLAGLMREVHDLYPGLEASRFTHEMMRRQITRMVEDVIASAFSAIDAVKPRSVDEVRAAGRRMIAFSDPMAEMERGLKTFLFQHLYRHPDVLAVRLEADRVVRDLFDAYMDDPASMPENWRAGMERADIAWRARHVADFLAGMTDTYALREYRRLFDREPRLG